MIYEAQSRETICDSLKIGCVIAGIGQISMRTFFISATKCDSWTDFVRGIESTEHARKTITAPTPMELDAFQGNCHKCGKYGHTAKECRSSSHGGAEKPQCAQCGKKHHGQCWIRSYTSSHKDSQKGGWKGDRKGNFKGTQKGGKFAGGKGGNRGKGKGKGKKGQRLNEITEPPEEQWTGGSWEAEDQAGFRSSYQTKDHLATYRMTEQKCHEWVSKCGQLRSTSRRHSAPSHTNQFGTPSYRDQKASVLTDEESDMFEIKKGTKQGDFLSSLLFNMVLQNSPALAKGKGMGIYLSDNDHDCLTNMRFADDVLLFASSKNSSKNVVRSQEEY